MLMMIKYNIYLIFIGPGSRWNRVPAEVVGHVCDFIKTLPTTTSHHSRSKYPNRRFLPVKMNDRYLYVMYLDWVATKYPEEAGKVTQSKFRDIKNKGFNITPRFVIL